MPQWFVLQAMHPVMGFPFLETRFLVHDLKALRTIVDGGEDYGDPHLRRIYWLARDELDLIEQRFGASLGGDDYEVILRPWHRLREAPYLIHTEFELPLMLEGRKPFAKFSDGYPSEWFEELVGKFDQFVDAGLIVRRTLRFPFEERSHKSTFQGLLEVYFARPGEEWRIDAYLLLREVANKTGWNDSLERYEGALLGYEDWQNDWWIERMRLHREQIAEERARLKQGG
jgi:hypothetical protein